MWGPIIEREPVDVGDESGSVVDAPFKLCYSTAQPYVELIEEIPGSEWECNEYSNLHHIGFWTDSVDADSGRWSAARCPLSLSRAVDGEKQMAYHRALGVRLEL